MNFSTQQAFAAFLVQLAKNYGVTDVGKQFTVVPELEQRFQDKIVEKENFLGKINVVPVEELSGKNVLGSANSPASGRTDTSDGTKERKPRNILGLEEWVYQLYKTNSDVFIPYDILDMWAKKIPNLGAHYTAYVQQQIANDRVMIGWHGVDAAADTDITTYSLLQDVNKGWFQYMRDNLPGNILTGGAVAGEIRIGTMDGADYANLDDVAHDLRQGIPSYLRKDLVVLVGEDLIGARNGILYKKWADTPSEKAGIAQAMASIGGMPWDTPSFFPDSTMVVTSYKNLSIYHQSGSWRRNLKDKPEQDQVQDFNSRNEGYVVEEPRAFAGLEFLDDNVKVPNAAGDAWV
ncbi:phage major capsid protein, P2 family [Pseudodesulfovibrio sp.]|uniref:phage major capsid protein, P2 family n=1 Tax=unclassified Pseudodesulfovibrio TaxID=2661612 RepID=UPI003B005D11